MSVPYCKSIKCVLRLKIPKTSSVWRCSVVACVAGGQSTMLARTPGVLVVNSNTESLLPFAQATKMAEDTHQFRALKKQQKTSEDHQSKLTLHNPALREKVLLKELHQHTTSNENQETPALMTTEPIKTPSLCSKAASIVHESTTSTLITTEPLTSSPHSKASNVAHESNAVIPVLVITAITPNNDQISTEPSSDHLAITVQATETPILENEDVKVQTIVTVEVDTATSPVVREQKTRSTRTARSGRTKAKVSRPSKSVEKPERSSHSKPKVVVSAPKRTRASKQKDSLTMLASKTCQLHVKKTKKSSKKDNTGVVETPKPLVFQRTKLDPIPEEPTPASAQNITNPPDSPLAEFLKTPQEVQFEETQDVNTTPSKVGKATSTRSSRSNAKIELFVSTSQKTRIGQQNNPVVGDPVEDLATKFEDNFAKTTTERNTQSKTEEIVAIPAKAQRKKKEEIHLEPEIIEVAAYKVDTGIDNKTHDVTQEISKSTRVSSRRKFKAKNLAEGNKVNVKYVEPVVVKMSRAAFRNQRIEDKTVDSEEVSTAKRDSPPAKEKVFREEVESHEEIIVEPGIKKPRTTRATRRILKEDEIFKSARKAESSKETKAAANKVPQKEEPIPENQVLVAGRKTQASKRIHKEDTLTEKQEDPKSVALLTTTRATHRIKVQEGGKVDKIVSSEEAAVPPKRNKRVHKENSEQPKKVKVDKTEDSQLKSRNLRTRQTKINPVSKPQRTLRSRK